MSNRDIDDQLLFNQKLTAKLIGISTQAFSKWDVQPHERRGREAFYYWPDVLEEYTRRRTPGEASEDSPLDLTQERARLAREQREKTALENAVTRRELMYCSQMDEMIGRALTAFRERLRSASSKLAPRVNPGNPNLARDLIDRELNEALAELADLDIGPEPETGLGEWEGEISGPPFDPEATPTING